MNDVRAAAAASLILAGCSATIPASAPSLGGEAALRVLRATGAGKIAHVVYIVQENRSFDNLFQGYPGADTVSAGKDSKGKTIDLVPVSLARHYVLDHSAQAMFADCNGTGKLAGTHCRMNGFDTESYFKVRNLKYPMYVYVQHSDSKPYFDMAHE